jgi:hypothetical protein
VRNTAALFCITRCMLRLISAVRRLPLVLRSLCARASGVHGMQPVSSHNIRCKYREEASCWLTSIDNSQHDTGQDGKLHVLGISKAVAIHVQLVALPPPGQVVSHRLPVQACQ